MPEAPTRNPCARRFAAWTPARGRVAPLTRPIGGRARRRRLYSGGMFESAELGHRVDKGTFAKKEPPLREALLDAQFEFIERKKHPIILVIGGVDGAGKGETVNLLNEWMDARHIRTHALRALTDEEREHPPMWRFWRELPPKGTIGIFFGSWYTMPVIERVYGETRKTELEEALERIVRFERMLVSEGALIVKFWLHLSKSAQKKRLRELSEDPKTAWRVTKTDWKHLRLYDDFRSVSERTLRETSTGEAPWVIVEGTDARYRSLTVGTVLLKAMRDMLDRDNAAESAATPSSSNGAPHHSEGHGEAHVLPVKIEPVDRFHILRSIDLSKKLPKRQYDRQLASLERKLNLLSRHSKAHKIGIVLVFEGNDAAGKGGTIRRVTGALDARRYQIFPVAAPTEDERAQPYLWRFWRHLPRRGYFTIFDRSWYGRVLVERVEGFCAPEDWRRAYAEINDFEAQLAEDRFVVVKFWLAISAEEQLRRFKERERTGFKRFKITDEDWRNRKKWKDYEPAVCEMIDRTSTEGAPWTLVPAEDKHYARITALRTVCERLQEAL
jgi:polyphosphate:AMP phosphotransferase